jgi:hypothetical protein
MSTIMGMITAIMSIIMGMVMTSPPRMNSISTAGMSTTTTATKMERR